MFQPLLILIAAAQAHAASPAKPVPVTLSRTSTLHEQLAYSVNSHMQVEIRGGEVQTFFPQDVDLTYAFTSDVSELKPGGVAVFHYKRPTMTQTTSESIQGPGGTKVSDVNLDYSVTLSPINEILAEKKLGSNLDLFSPGLFGAPAVRQDSNLSRFIVEIHMLARNLGSLDSSLDFAPKLPVDDVVPGDIWKHTVGYSPQSLASQGGKLAVQRLDYTYTYIGVVQSDGKKVYRVTADLDTSTNLADFYFQATGEDPSGSMLKSLPLNLKSHVDFDLDIKTCETLKAVSSSTGGFSIVLTSHPDQPAEEERFKATTTMLLKSRK
jgi:hypothetical protein